MARILLIDDDDAVGKMIFEILVRAGHDVADLLQQVREQSPGTAGSYRRISIRKSFRHSRNSTTFFESSPPTIKMNKMGRLCETSGCGVG